MPTYFITEMSIHHLKPGDSVATVPLPNRYCGNPTFLWPKSVIHDGQNCLCRPVEDEYFSFERCVQNCDSDYNITLTSNAVVFQNISSITEDFMVHFLCDETCIDTPCLMESIILTYNIEVDRKLNMIRSPWLS